MEYLCVGGHNDGRRLYLKQIKAVIHLPGERDLRGIQCVETYLALELRLNRTFVTFYFHDSLDEDQAVLRLVERYPK